jgi:hypothetical protein
MSGKGVLRLALLVFTALLGAGLTLGALTAPRPTTPHSQASQQR